MPGVLNHDEIRIVVLERNYARTGTGNGSKSHGVIYRAGHETVGRKVNMLVDVKATGARRYGYLGESRLHSEGVVFCVMRECCM